MAPKLFLTGTTGYIGGTVLDTLIKAHPDWSYTVLLRNVPAIFAERYPHVRIVHGDYSSADVILAAASQADIVIHSGNSDDEPSIKAIIAGLLTRNEASYLIHLSGTGIIDDWIEGTHLGEFNPKVWSDIDDIDAITSMRDDALHRNVDKIIQEAAVAHPDKLKTAIICPPCICGKGRGPGRTQSVLLPVLRTESLRRGAPFYYGSGANMRNWVHLDDLMQVYLKLVEAAAAKGGNATWGKEGYYFTTTHETSHLELAVEVGKILHAKGLISSPDPIQISLDEVDSLLPDWGIPRLGRYVIAGNSRTQPDRATKFLNFKPTGRTVWEDFEADMEGSGDSLSSAAVRGMAAARQ
ncbi:nucleoside-diphosphate-sugar epimerase [Punctularia strigosozonata HHB-11173 SS5]|uniref:nucleoside-diphosphate-sugar epimerase n=1 Tax=Punctularia strigosozonata (strain HHB-11173) TaxID=741275 RepID=UPI0004416606|nr:nucleoside-diphosphate-sugar epimerase [Punctularia strigosozonata HHB-11173 SS5]EIN13348.1 nucleoside-diphosphate-sugar epimerase [Punctularia strigosozonata HHB-11173 SS5]